MKRDEAPAAATPPDDDSVAAARSAGLRYVTDSMAGIRRERSGDAVRYLAADGSEVDDETTLARIRALVIPPAWTDVWICKQANGHLQATGRDAKGRKQYRYHARWRDLRDEVKYERMISFGRALPAVRRQVDADLKRAGLPREKVLATIVYLLEATMMRIGNEEYARTNKSFGLTTLRSRHVRIDGSAVQFKFRGKSGVHHAVTVDDKRLARIIARIRDLPGQELFHYIDDDGEPHNVDSADVNEYLRQVTGEDYTAKDFRTWSGTVLAALALQEFEKFDSEAQAKKNIVRAIEMVAEKLGNTPSICRKCYVHPAVLDAYLDGTVLEAMRESTRRELVEDLHELQPEEAAVVALLQNRLQNTAPSKPKAKAKRKPEATTETDAKPDPAKKSKRAKPASPAKGAARAAG